MKKSRFFPVEKHISILLSSIFITATSFALISYFSNQQTANAKSVEKNDVTIADNANLNDPRPSGEPQSSSNPVLVVGLPDFSPLVEKASPAVVNIRTTQKIDVRQMNRSPFEDDEADEFFRRFFGVPSPQQPSPRNRGQQAPKRQEVPRGVGSGFIVSTDGYILTNTHVVEGASDVYVKLTDKREFKAKVIGSDKRTDVAVIKIEGTNLPKLMAGDSNKIKVGEWVIAIGSPFDLDNTVTSGIISSKSRDTGDYLPLIQTDVAVNPGNSGGPLINMRGEVIGINSQIYSRSGGYMGISFAIPIDEAMRVVEQLKSKGSVSRARIGVEIGDINREVAESLGLPKEQGALVAAVESNGPAERAGLQAGDVILKFNGQAIEKRSDLPRLVGSAKPNTKASVTVWRKGASKDMEIVLGQAEPDTQSKTSTEKETAKSNVLGLRVADMSDAQRKAQPNQIGVVVESAEGAAALAGLRSGDVIVMLNNQDITSAKQFENIAAKLDKKKSAVVLVRRNNSSNFVVIRPVID